MEEFGRRKEFRHGPGLRWRIVELLHVSFAWRKDMPRTLEGVEFVLRYDGVVADLPSGLGFLG